MTADERRSRNGEPDPVVIRDKRRLDPTTGQPRDPDPAAGVPPVPDASPVEPSVREGELEIQLAERTADLQRLQAEFANYRKRVDRDRITVRENATGDVLAALLPVVDDVDRARSHGDLDGAFKAVADQLDVLLTKLGLEAFGETGDRFDPALHEAVLHDESADVTEPTATMIMRKGYRHADRLLRPAMVGVTDPSHAAESRPAADTQADDESDPSSSED